VVQPIQPEPPKSAWREWLLRGPRAVRKWGSKRLSATQDRIDKWDRRLAASNSPLLAGLVVAAVLVAVGLVLVVLIPEILAWLLWSDIGADARTTWTDSLRKGLLGVLTLGSVAAWVIQYRQAAMERLVDEYNARIRQLSQDTWEQVAGIRDLEAIAMKNDQLRRKTLQMLAVFVRDRAPRNEALDRVSTDAHDKDGPRGKRRPEPAVQEALRVIGDHLPEWAPQQHRTKEDLQDAHQDAGDGEADEGGGVVGDADARLLENYVSLADIAIDGAVLRCAQMTGLNLRRSLLRDIKLEGADLSYAKLRNAVLSDADLEGARLVGASLVGAKLNRADLRRADLRKANLKRVHLTGAMVAGAHLSGAVGLSDELRQTIGTPHCLPDGPECLVQASGRGQR
jgi:hypothetical protein